MSDAPQGVYKIDRMKFDKVLVNLATNALKFTPEGGSVKLVARRSAPDGWVEFIVEDTGEGMTETELENIFRRFWQADTSSKRRHRGAGIGLSLVKGIVDLLEGEVEVKSTLGEGTRLSR